MKVLTLPLSVRRRLLEHETDLLTPAVEERARRFGKPCPKCGGATQQHLAEKPFNNLSLLPRTTAICVDCGHETDTQSGLTVKEGNAAKVESPFPLINPKDD